MELEVVEFGDVRLELPQDICWDYSLLAEIISPETWNNCLTEENREELMNYLPTFPENDLELKTHTLEMFFMDVNFRHGTPLRNFHRLLQSGYFNPNIAKQRKKREQINRKIWRHEHAEYLRCTLEATIVRRQQYIDLAKTLGPDCRPVRISQPSTSLMSINGYNSSAQASSICSTSSWKATLDQKTKKRYFRELLAAKSEAGLSAELSEDENYPEGGGAVLSKKQRRLLCSAEASLPQKLLPIRHTHSSGSFGRDLELAMTMQYNPLELTEANFDDLLTKYIYKKRTKRKNGEYCLWSDISGIRLNDIVWRTCESSKRLPAGVSVVRTDYKCSSKTKVKKERITHDTGSRSWSPITTLKTENLDDEDDEQNVLIDNDQDGDSLSAFSRYVSLGSGEVKNEASSTEGDFKGRKRLMKLGILPSIKKKVPEQSSKEKTVSNGAAVKDEPPDDRPVASQDSLFLNSRCGSEEMQVSVLPQTHACFFCLLRDIICQPNDQRLTRPQLECCVEAWQQSIVTSGNNWSSNTWHRHVSQLHPPMLWLQALPAAICFLAGFSPELQPPDFVPYIEYKETVQAYQWIGAGRDSDSKLQPLYQHWITNRSGWSDIWLPKGEDSAQGSVLREELLEEEAEEDEGEESIPLPRFPTNWVVQPSSEEEKNFFRAQEKIRYERPHKAFTYRVHGYEAVVGPVKGIYSQHSGPNKARGHSLLTSSRPAYVTILALVRDAVARLPNGEGTRAEICELLRESQYVAPLQSTAAEGALNSVVSGALDRLHYEQDPCVKYLANKKLWVYLHRNRDEKEFERMHHLHGPGTPRTKKLTVRRHGRPKTPSREGVKPPPNVALDPLNTSAKVEGVQVAMLPEDILVKRDVSNQALSGTVASNISSTILRNINSNNNKAALLSSINAVAGPQVSYTAGSVQHTLLSTGQSSLINSNNALPNSTNTGSSIYTGSAVAINSGSTFTVKGLLVKSTASSTPAVTLSSPALITTAAQNTMSIGAFVTATISGAPIFSLSTSTPSNTVLKVAGGSMRTIMASNLQTIQVSTASGIQTIRVALPSTALGKGNVISNVSESGGTVSNTPSKRLPQQLGQLIQTSTGTHFIATGGGRGSLNIAQLSQVTTPVKRTPGQSPAIVRLSSSVPALSGAATLHETASLPTTSTVVSMSIGPTASVGSPRVSVRSLGSSSANLPTVLSNLSSTPNRGDMTVRNLSHAASSTNTCTSPSATTVTVSGTTRFQSIAPQQLAGLKLVQGAAHLQPGIGQKLVVSGNKVLLQGGKVMQGNVQHLVTLQPQKQPLSVASSSSGVQSATFVPQSSSSAAQTGVHQQRLIVAPVTHSAAGNKATRGVGNLISIGNKVILAAQNVSQGGQVIVSGDKLGQVLMNGEKITGQVLNIGGQQVLVTAQGGSNTGQLQQQIVLPASTLQGGQISIKGLQAFHTLKVMPSGGSVSTSTVRPQSQANLTATRVSKPMVARIVQQTPVRPSGAHQLAKILTKSTSKPGTDPSPPQMIPTYTSISTSTSKGLTPVQNVIKSNGKTVEQSTSISAAISIDQKVLASIISSNSSSFRNSPNSS
ncbi:nuclear factor related to kappa-B-binding protein isoform X1 [Hyalella azteca]|uniref:Nuclear factor related to kappa-B-binding protein isoform X1 n=1 Tax=Hyalella azteca TaxID=294128 RepID=A0A979FXW2_HYAAZ|nr:nuclear factor related to kappa-B-binding protein isoform X1 [Hyalella azteca]